MNSPKPEDKSESESRKEKKTDDKKVKKSHKSKKEKEKDHKKKKEEKIKYSKVFILSLIYLLKIFEKLLNLSDSDDSETTKTKRSVLSGQKYRKTLNFYELMFKGLPWKLKKQNKTN